jgi:hypothetical protein
MPFSHESFPSFNFKEKAGSKGGMINFFTEFKLYKL